MDNAKEMLLADAIQTAIEQTKTNIKQKRIIIALTVLCGILSVAHIIR